MTAGTFSGVLIGFDDDSGNGTLSDRNFTYDGVNYSIRQLFFQPSDESLNFGFDVGDQTALTQPELTLHVGNSLSDIRQFALTDGMTGGAALFWTNSGLSWEEGDRVLLRLTVDLSQIDPLPTLSASISGDPREGGEAVTLTLTLSEAVDAVTSMQRRVGGTADTFSDYDWVSIPTFAAGSTTATTQIKAVDDSEAEGCETITWTMTMWPGTYWAVHKFYTVYIEDNDGGDPCPPLSQRAPDGGVGGL